jgi:hypothetical protein
MCPVMMVELLTAIAKMPQLSSLLGRKRIHTRKSWSSRIPSLVSRPAQRLERTRGAAMKDVPMELSREEFVGRMVKRNMSIFAASRGVPIKS